MNRLFSAVLVAMLTTLTACVLAPPRDVPAQTGRVLDEETQQPLEGAIVVLRWQGVGTKGIVDTQTVCYHVESAVTDANGHYATLPWKEESRYRDLSMKQVLETVYKPGYRQVQGDVAKGIHYLVPFEGSREERFKYLERLFVASGCGATDGSEQNGLAFAKALYSEAVDISKTQEEKRMLEFFLYAIEKLELGFEEAEKRHLERVDK